MGVRTGGDGRLDLDELGSVIEGATSADAPETLHDGLARPSLAERLEDAGALPWLRAHRPLVAATTVLALGGVVALAVHQANQPPPLDPRVTAALVPVRPAAVEDWGGTGSGAGIVTARMVVTGVPGGDSVRVVGLSGPGLGATTASPLDGFRPGLRPDQDPDAMPWSAAATIDCGSPRSLTADPDEYSVLLQRTDRWGRTSTASRPLPGSAQDWADQVRGTCWDRAVQEGVDVDDLTARADPARGTVSIGLVLSNDTPLDLIAGSEPTDLDEQGVRVGQSFRVGLAAGLGAQTEVLLSITSCDRAAPPLVGVPQSRDGGAVAMVPGIDLYVASPDRLDAMRVPLALAAEQTATVRSAVDAVCADAPGITVRPVGAPVVQALGGPTDERQMRIALDVRPTAGAVSAVDVRGDAGLPTVFSARTVPEGPGPVDVVWRYTCANTPAPPTVSLTVVDGERTWPWRGVLTDESIERALLRGCSGQTAEALVGTGWPARVPVPA